MRYRICQQGIGGGAAGCVVRSLCHIAAFQGRTTEGSAAVSPQLDEVALAVTVNYNRLTLLVAPD